MILRWTINCFNFCFKWYKSIIWSNLLYKKENKLGLVYYLKTLCKPYTLYRFCNDLLILYPTSKIPYLINLMLQNIQDIQD